MLASSSPREEALERWTMCPWTLRHGEWGAAARTRRNWRSSSSSSSITRAVSEKRSGSIFGPRRERAPGHAEARAREPERESAEMRLQEWYEILRDELALRLDRALEGPGLESTAGRLRSGDTDPYTAALDVPADPAALARVLRDPRDGDSE